jgi:hypothetical protein
MVSLLFEITSSVVELYMFTNMLLEVPTLGFSGIS